MVDRIASFAQTNQLIENNLRVQKKYAEGQIQTSSGLKSDTYEGIARDTNQILNLESDYSRLTSQSENAQKALDRSEASFDAVGSIIDIAQSFQADISAALSLTADPAEIEVVAEQDLQQIEALLNTQVAGRYIFSGSATQTAPADFNDPAFGGAVIPSTADTSYYQGNDFEHTVEASDDLKIEYGMSGDDTALEQIIRAYDLVRTTPGDPDTLEEALDLIQNGLDGLAVAKSTISETSQNLDQSINDNLDQMNLIDSMISDLQEVDLAEVTVKLQEMEAQLEASYAVTADLLRLNLTDFI